MLTLSTGQVRRAPIARALINGPAVLVFDEPCVGLDPEAAWNMRQSLSALAKAGHTILVVTHDVSDIMPEFDRVVMLQDARIVADGPKSEVLTTQRLRHLFGVPITLVETDGHYHLQ
jgi:iron complex transport system ATP-binding protein